MTKCQHFLLLVGVMPLFAAPVLPQPITIDTSKGVIDGRVAVSFWPSAGLESRELRDPTGFEVHLVPVEDQDQEYAYPCGTWFQPPRGRYRLWMETDGWMSPHPAIFIYAGSRFEGAGMAGVSPVVPAGTVKLSEDLNLGSNHRLRLLHMDSHNVTPLPRREISRRADADAARIGVRMPEGPALVMLFDNEAGEYLALSRPVQVTRNTVTTARPEPPTAGSDLLVALDRPSMARDKAEYDVELMVGGPKLPDTPPAVVVRTIERLYAVWYGLGGSYVNLKVSSPTVFLEPQEVVLTSGKVAMYRGKLRRLPAVDVQLDLPSQLITEELALAVLTDPEGDQVRHEKVSLASRQVRLEKLPAEPLEIMLEVPPWDFRERVDLSDGEDRTVVFSPPAIHVHGTVYRGDEEHPGVVSFRVGGPGREVAAPADEDGAYETVLFHPGYYVVFVALEGARGPRYVDFLDEPIMADTKLDFHIPANVYRVRVVDATSGTGVAGAEVGADNAGERKKASQGAVTDADGVAELQPLRPGTLEVWVTAEGYLPSERLTEQVPDGQVERELTIMLRPVESTARLRVVLGDGSPAAGAEVRAQPALDNALPLWENRCDAQGLVDVPAQADGAFLLIRHPAAGILIRPWRGSEVSGNDLVWRLPAAATPLRVRVTNSWGEPAAWAQLAVWIDGVRVTGRTLAWMAGSTVGGSDSRGLWQAHNLPATPIGILAWMRSEAAGALGGSYDSMASPVAYPWTETVEIEALE